MNIKLKLRYCDELCYSEMVTDEQQFCYYVVSTMSAYVVSSRSTVVFVRRAARLAGGRQHDQRRF